MLSTLSSKIGKVGLVGTLGSGDVLPSCQFVHWHCPALLVCWESCDIRLVQQLHNSKVSREEGLKIVEDSTLR